MSEDQVVDTEKYIEELGSYLANGNSLQIIEDAYKKVFGSNQSALDVIKKTDKGNGADKGNGGNGGTEQWGREAGVVTAQGTGVTTHSEPESDFMWQNDKGRWCFSAYKFAKYMGKEIGLLAFSNKPIFLFTGKKYDRIEKEYLCKIVWGETKHKLPSTRVKEFAEAALWENQEPKFHEKMNPNGFLNCQNGYLDLRKADDITLHPHSKDKLFSFVLDYDYEQGAQCPMFLKFLGEALDNDPVRIQVIKEFFGYLFFKKPTLHKALVLLGRQGNNGKSTLLTILEAMIGHGNAVHIDLDKIGHNFSVVRSVGKLVNIIDEKPDVRNGKPIDSEAFKKVVTGGTVQAAFKSKDEFEVAFNAKLIMACNELPTFSDKSPALFRRFQIVSFNRSFTKEEVDPNLAEKIIKDELPGILNWAIEGYQYLVRRRRFTDSEDSERAVRDFREESDNIYAWFHEYMLVDERAEVLIPFTEMYEHFMEYYGDSSRYKMTRVGFAKRLKPVVQEAVSLKGLNVEKCYQRNTTARGYRHIVFKSDF